MKYLIDKEKLFGYDLKNFYTFLLAFMNSLVPYEEEKEEPTWKFENPGFGCHHDAMGKCNTHGNEVECGCLCHNIDTRCTKCNGVGEIEKEFILYGSKYNERMICQHCNGTGEEPRKEKCYHHHIVDGRCVRGCLDKQDTRTHAWDTPELDTSKVTRVEVIDHTKSVEEGGGRAYVFWERDKAVTVNLMLQDDDRTLKIFIEKL